MEENQPFGQVSFPTTMQVCMSGKAVAGGESSQIRTPPLPCTLSAGTDLSPWDLR